MQHIHYLPRHCNVFNVSRGRLCTDRQKAFCSDDAIATIGSQSSSLEASLITYPGLSLSTQTPHLVA